jgi:hypothetical protein
MFKCIIIFACFLATKYEHTYFGIDSKTFAVVITTIELKALFFSPPSPQTSHLKLLE